MEREKERQKEKEGGRKEKRVYFFYQTFEQFNYSVLAHNQIMDAKIIIVFLDSKMSSNLIVAVYNHSLCHFVLLQPFWLFITSHFNSVDIQFSTVPSILDLLSPKFLPWSRPLSFHSNYYYSWGRRKGVRKELKYGS